MYRGNYPNPFPGILGRATAALASALLSRQETIGLRTP